MASLLVPPVGDADHVIGNGSASVEIVEYGDFQCPHCAAAHPVILEMIKTFGDQIRFVFRNFPLSESHRYATIAAIGAEAAALQDRYWEMHHIIFENQASLSDHGIHDMADKIGLDTDRFEKDMDDDRLHDKVETDFESGIRSGVNGTPSFFVNGKKFDGGVQDLFDVLKEG